VHEALFTSRSEFLQRATSRDNQETDVRMLAVTLPDDDPNTFHLYLNLVYANQLVTKGTKQWLKLCQLYVLAEKLQDITSKNRIIDGMHVFFNELVLKNILSVDTKRMLPATATAKLYEGTPCGSQARKLIVDLYTDFGEESWVSDKEAKLPTEFIYDIALRVLQRRARIVFGSQINRSSTHYHEVRAFSPRTTGTVTGDVKEASINEQSKMAEAVTVAEKESVHVIRQPKDVKTGLRLGVHGVAADHTLPPVLGTFRMKLK
jgi:hypothetical protein